MYLLSLKLRLTDLLPGNSSQYETPNSNGCGATDDSGTEPDSETTERVLSCPSKQTPNKAGKAYF